MELIERERNYQAARYVGLTSIVIFITASLYCFFDCLEAPVLCLGRVYSSGAARWGA